MSQIITSLCSVVGTSRGSGTEWEFFSMTKNSLQIFLHIQFRRSKKTSKPLAKCQTRRPATTSTFSLCFLTKMFYGQLLQLKKLKKSVFNLVFKYFPHILCPPSPYAFLGIINLSRLQSKVRSRQSVSE